jgi:anaerobic selenocysteine-containing dehydrogenase
MDRRQFFKVTAAGSATASLAGCGNPENQLIRFIPEEEFVPGVATVRPSVCPLCPAGCGVQVRVMDGDVELTFDGVTGVMKRALAKKLEGNPAHPVNRGKLCVRGQAAIQVTYHPDRISRPLRRVGARGSGQFEEISWEDALAEVVSQLDALVEAGRPEGLRFVTRPLQGQKAVLVSQFLARFGAPSAVVFEVFPDTVLRTANALSFGYEQLPTFDLARSNYVLAFGADFLGTWNSPVAQNFGYGEMRQGRLGQRGKFVQVEPRMSQTGANADEWLPANPGTEGALALGLAHVIMNEGFRNAGEAGRAGALIDGWADGLPDHAPEATEARTGVSADRIQRLAREFVSGQPGVALIGGAPLAHTNGLVNALAVNALNALVGSIGVAGGLFFTPRPEMNPGLDTEGTVGEDETIQGLALSILASSESPIGVLLLNDTNPVFGTPQAWRVAEAIAQVPFVVGFGHFVDDTNVLADLILPDHSFLESWIEGVPESGSIGSVASVGPPAMRPLYDTRAMPDVLLDLGRGLTRPLDPALPWDSYEDMIEMSFRTLPAPEGADALWAQAQEDGGWFGEAASQAAQPAAPDTAALGWEQPEFEGDVAEYPFHFLPFASQAFLDGSLAHLPWLQELPDVLSTAMWSCWVEINPQTAARLGVEEGDMVEITSGHGAIEAPVWISPGIAPDVIAMPVGQGHQTFTRYASGRGANPLAILAPVVQPETNALAWAATRVRVTRTDGQGELILFAGAMREEEHPR